MCRRDCFTADLQRSGVGNAELLAEFDIPLVHELPGVGENLQDHTEMYLQYSAKNRFPSPCSAVVESAENRCGWLFGGTGVGCQQPL